MDINTFDAINVIKAKGTNFESIKLLFEDIERQYAIAINTINNLNEKIKEYEKTDNTADDSENESGE